MGDSPLSKMTGVGRVGWQGSAQSDETEQSTDDLHFRLSLKG